MARVQGLSEKIDAANKLFLIKLQDENEISSLEYFRDLLCSIQYLDQRGLGGGEKWKQILDDVNLNARLDQAG